jgi:hypothetical protein
MKVLALFVIILAGTLAAPTFPGLPGYSPQTLGVSQIAQSYPNENFSHFCR